jgi:hypothetical protein
MTLAKDDEGRKGEPFDTAAGSRWSTFFDTIVLALLGTVLIATLAATPVLIWLGML